MDRDKYGISSVTIYGPKDKYPNLEQELAEIFLPMIRKYFEDPAHMEEYKRYLRNEKRREKYKNFKMAK